MRTHRQHLGVLTALPHFSLEARTDYAASSLIAASLFATSTIHLARTEMTIPSGLTPFGASSSASSAPIS
jgi:hypothetical protein